MQKRTKTRAKTKTKAATKPQRRPSVSTARNEPRGERYEYHNSKTGRSTPMSPKLPASMLEVFGGIEQPVQIVGLPSSVAAALELAAGLGARIAAAECPDTATAYDSIEALGGMVGESLQIAAHEKVVIDELLYHLEARKRELQEELTTTLDAVGLTEDPVSVRGCVVRFVRSHTSRLDRSELLKRGVDAAVIEASTVRSDYTYAKITVPGLRENGGRG